VHRGRGAATDDGTITDADTGERDADLAGCVGKRGRAEQHEAEQERSKTDQRLNIELHPIVL
jgi:hypothetical protein